MITFKNKNSYQHLSTEESNQNSMKYISGFGGSANNINQEKINKLYQENQKLAYRLNYLTDENNFYKISINNIKKLNLNINKHLDSVNGNRTLNNINSKNNSTPFSSKQNTIHNNNLLLNQRESIHQSMSKLKSKTLMHRTSNNNEILNLNGLQNQKFNEEKINEQNNYQNTNPKDITQPYSMISNKIHLKNLQIKVGNSIRKADKLKKLYEGSLSILNKKVDYLQNQINVLAREAEFYSIENQLLENIYKADYYITLNQQGKNNQFQFNRHKKTEEDSSQIVKQSINCQIGVSNNLITQITDQQIQNLEHYIRNSKKKLTSKTTKSQKPNPNFQVLRKRPSIQQNSKQKSTIKIKHKIQQNPPITRTIPNNNLGRFFSGDATKPRLKIESGSNSACFQGKSSITKRINQLSKRALLKNTNTNKQSNLQTINGISQFDQIQSLNINEAQSLQRQNDSNKKTNFSQFDMKKNTKEIYQLPQAVIDQIIVSLQNEEISQMNKIQSLRKEQKQQKKKKVELNQKIQKLNEQKNSIKAQIQSHFEHLTKTIKYPKGKGINMVDIHERQQDAFKLHQMNLRQAQLLNEIQRQDKALQDQYKINQDYKQKIVDRNEQQSKEIKLLQEEVNKCLEQVRQIKLKYKDVIQHKKNKLKS